MKRLCLILAYLFLFTQTAFAMPLLVGQKVVYRGTITDLRISAVDGTAFIDNVSITSELQNAKLLSSGSVTAANLKLSAADGVAFVDFSAADVLTNNIGKYIVIKDSTGREIKGWIKAAGSSEGLGADLLSGLDISDGNWATTTATINSSAIFTLTSTAGSVYRFLLTTGCLYKTSLVGTKTATSFFLAQIGGSQKIIDANAGYGYRTATSTRFQFQGNGEVGNTCTITTADLFQVTAPSATGVTIVSTKGGTTYNWESKDASFTYNSAITYSIYDRDLTAYADGNHQIEIYDSSNRMLKGVLKAAGTSETTGSDLLTGLDISSGWTAIGTPATTINDADTYTANTTSSGVRKSLWTLGALYKGFLTVSITGTSTYAYLGRSSNDVIIAGAGTQYKTVSIDTNVYIATVGATTGTVTDILTASLSQVTAPSSSGATITTLKNGDVYNWSYKNDSFTYNASSYYVIIRAIR